MSVVALASCIWLLSGGSAWAFIGDANFAQFDPRVEWSTLVEVYRGHAGARQAWESFSGELAQLATYRRGKLITLRDFPSHAEALEAVGLAE